MRIKKILPILLFFTFKCFSEICYFVPPENWKSADPSKLSKYVSIGFVGKSRTSFKPSINLATEKTDASLKQYVKAIKDSYKNDKKAVFAQIGKIKNQIDGETILIEINKQSSFGEICLLQCITKKNDDMFVMTGAVLKEELLKFKDDFFKSFKSLKTTDDLILELKENSQVTTLKQKLNELKEKKISSEDFEKLIDENYNNLGSYWKILVLKLAYENINEQ
jgi:hypothetical protein